MRSQVLQNITYVYIVRMMKIIVEIVKKGGGIVLEMVLTVGGVDGTICSFRSLWILSVGDRSQL